MYCIELSFVFQITFSTIAQRELDWTCEMPCLVFWDKVSHLLIFSNDTKNMAIIHACMADIYLQSSQKPETLSRVKVYDLNACQRISTVLNI